MKGVGRPRACTGLPFPASRVSDIEQAQERHPAAHPVVGPQRTCASAASEIQAKPRHCTPYRVLAARTRFCETCVGEVAHRLAPRASSRSSWSGPWLRACPRA